MDAACAQYSNSARSPNSSSSTRAGSYGPSRLHRTKRWLRATTAVGSSCSARTVRTRSITPSRVGGQRAPARPCLVSVRRRTVRSETGRGVPPGSFAILPLQPQPVERGRVPLPLAQHLHAKVEEHLAGQEFLDLAPGLGADPLPHLA